MIRFLLLSVFIVLLSCKNERIVTKTSSDINVILTEDAAEFLGYRLNATREVVQSQWDNEAFGKALIMEQDIKSIEPMEGKENMYPRYTIIRESYKDTDSANRRGLRLRDFDPKIDAKTKEHAGLVLRKGFVSNRDVIIVTTNAVIFSHDYLDNLVCDLERLYNN